MNPQQIAQAVIKRVGTMNIGVTNKNRLNAGFLNSVRAIIEEEISKSENRQVKRGINPVTIRNEANDQRVTISRLHIGGGPTEMVKSLTVALSAGDEAAEDTIKMMMVTVPEDCFISGLGHVFGRGELREAHLEDL